jgi:hypothetical protein
MMYIQESLGPGEKILKFTQYHWIYVALSVLSASIFILLALAVLFVGTIYHYYDIVKVPPWRIFEAAAQLTVSDYFKAIWHLNIIVRVGVFLLLLMAIIQVGARVLVRVTTEMGVTNRRVVMKRGLVSRKVDEMRVDFIDGVDLDQTIMGRILNYGCVRMYGTGQEGIVFPVYMEDPVNFRRAVQAARAVQISGVDQNGPKHILHTSDDAQPQHPLHQQHYPPQFSSGQQPQQNINPHSAPVSPEQLKHLHTPAVDIEDADIEPGSRHRAELHEQ